MEGVEFMFHPSTGLEPETFDMYYEDFPMIVGVKATIPHRYHRESIIRIMGPEYPPAVMNSIIRTVQLQRFEYLARLDQAALEFGKYLEDLQAQAMGNPPMSTSSEHTDHSYI